MNYSIFSVVIILFLFSICVSQDQKNDNGIFVEPKNEFMEEIKDEIQKYEEDEEKPKIEFHMNFEGMTLPTSLDQFDTLWHQPPVSQGRTGACWCLCATSYFESEIYRIYHKEIKLSAMHTVYWEFVEKARRYVQERGNSLFAEGSMANAVTRIWRKYGVVPLEFYPGLTPEQKFHNHSKMFNEMNSYLISIKEDNIWNEIDVLANIKAILNYYMGEPPIKVFIDDQSLTPLKYLENELQLNLDDYVDVLSIKEKEYYQKVSYPVPDNWWINSDYFNLPLDEFIALFNRSLIKGYTISLAGDTSEPGYDAYTEVAMVPTFDIPSKYINEDSRQFRFSNNSTTDDHGIHAVGIMKMGKDYWYLIKDSGSGARNGPNKGYRFYHQDYVKLKIMDIMVHKDVLGDLLEKYEGE